MTWNAKSIAGVSLVTLLVIAIAIAAYLSIVYLKVAPASESDNLPNNLTFESTAWQMGSPRERGQMVNYLLDSIGIADRSEEELTALLGPPDYQWESGDTAFPYAMSYAVDQGNTDYNTTMIVFLDSSHRSTESVLFDD